MNTVSFSHNYPKLWGQQTALLLLVTMVDRHELCEDFVEYDTHYYADARHYFLDHETGPDGPSPIVKKHYSLRPGRYLLLVFYGDKKIPFTTVRPWSKDKAEYYSSSVGSHFEIVINPEPSNPEL